jgi:hypothetical protein
MENNLWKIFDNINRWLDFAEKKNAIILTIIAIQITLIKSFIFSLNLLALAGILILSMCLIVSIISFFPILNLQKIILKVIPRRKSYQELDSIIYFGDIANFSKAEYIEKIERTFNMKISDNSFFLNLCDQIVANSHIANRKFLLFRICAFLMIIGQTLFILSFFF